jgi:hypothetical protein
MDKFYFEYPERGGIFYSLSVAAAVDAADVARLKDGQLASLTVLERMPPVVSEVHPVDGVPTIEGRRGRVWEAIVVLDLQADGIPHFGGDWESLFEIMEAVAYVNAPLPIVLTEEEYQRLEAGGLEDLKDRVSPNVVGRLVLMESYPVDGGESPVLLVAHLGRCPC